MARVVGLKELAEEVGVSISTVSRALQGSSLVREQTRRRIHAAVNARRIEGAGLRSRPLQPAAQMLALVQPAMEETDGDTEISIRVLEALQDVAEQRSCSVLAGRLRHAASSDADPLPDLDQAVLGVVGFRLLDRHMPTFLPRVRAAGVPFVLLNRTEEDASAPSCTTDHAHAGEMAIDHLVSLGHKRIALLFNGTANQSNRLRIAGIAAALARHRIRLVPALRMTDLADAGAARDAAEIMVRRHRATALVVAHDRMGLDILHHMASCDIQVPHRVSMISFDGTDAAGRHSPALTTLRTPWRRMARAAAQLLFSLREDPDLHQANFVWKPTLIAGQTCAKPPASNQP